MNTKRRDLILTNTEKKPLRPVLFASKRTLYEYSVYLKHLLVGLADESIPAVLVCPPDTDLDDTTTGPVEVVRHPVLQLPLMKRLNKNMLLEQLLKFKPTILYCLCESESPLTRQLARKLDLPYILTVNSLHKRWDNLHISSKRCSKIIVPAKSIAVNIASVQQRFAERIEQINIGTFIKEDTGRFHKASRLAALLTTHPLDDVNDFETLFNAIKHLSVDGYEFTMVVTGDGRADGQIRKLLAALDLLHIVTIVPKLKPLRSVLAAGDIFIQPQPSDTFNPLLLEAMSVGLAVAGCKGGADDLIIEGKTAVIFNPNDELSIHSCLQRLLDRPEFARQIAKAAQQYLKENHPVSNMISATLRALHEAQQ